MSVSAELFFLYIARFIVASNKTGNDVTNISFTSEILISCFNHIHNTDTCTHSHTHVAKGAFMSLLSLAYVSADKP